jgi:hypothetical protein
VTVQDLNKTKIRTRSRCAVIAVSTLAVILALLAGTPKAQGQGQGQGQGGGGKPITITQMQALDFANIGSVQAASGTAVLDPSTGAKSVTGGVVDFGGVHLLAMYDLTGSNNGSYTIILPGTITITEPGGTTTTITNFTSFPSGTGTFSGQGTATLVVGATLRVAAGQQSGVYTDLFDVTVAY